MSANIKLYLDTECFSNYFLILASDDAGKHVFGELHDDSQLDPAMWSKLLCNKAVEVNSFNGRNYDVPMISAALTGRFTNQQLKEISDKIINEDVRPWEIAQMYEFDLLEFNHVDLIEVAPGMNGLKTYAGRLHAKKLQDLPLDPSEEVTPDMRSTVRQYCYNDTRLTKILADALKGEVDLRRTLSDEIGVDVRSKSDAQIAEAVLRKAIIQARGLTKLAKYFVGAKPFFYKPPAYVKFRSENLRDALHVLTTEKFTISESGHVVMPEKIDQLDIRIAGRPYKMGIGGLHSQESEVSIYADDDYKLRDIDVVSYYPNLILNMGMFPKMLGPEFLDEYRKILTRRVEAKRNGDKVTDAVLKITLNGTFGKTSNKYSILYNPEMMLHTTLTGQLSILMLIEALEHFNISVMSANTDGILVLSKKADEDKLNTIVQRWQWVTNLQTDQTMYRSIHSRDVNNYIAVKEDGSVKRKGFFGKSGLWKNPQNDICTDAVVKYLQDGTPCEVTIRECTDIRKFITLRRVNGGAVQNGQQVGKIIRWYYSTESDSAIHYESNGNTVPRSEGAKPVMQLPDEFPSDINYDWYIKECDELLMDLAVKPRPPAVKLPRKNSKAWKQMVADGLLTP